MKDVKNPVNMRGSECARTCVRKKNILKRGIAAVFLGALCLVSPLTEVSVEAAEAGWSFDYTGDVQSFIAPYTGIYHFGLYGAQGGSYKTLVGGKGGEVKASLVLNKGDNVEIYVGGQDGYNGGGSGKVSSGGGATDIRVNGERIVIAGGGGGATTKKNGGDGGSTKSGNNKTSYVGSASNQATSAGGGAGYLGGTAGYYSAGHTHDDSCYSSGCGGKVIKSEEPAPSDGENWFSRKWYCSVCGASKGVDKYYPGVNDPQPSEYVCSYGRELLCSTSVSGTVNSAAYGGSSWYNDSVCTETSSMAGVREGNGMVTISIDGFSNLYYSNVNVIDVNYGGQKVKQVYYNGELIYFMP